MLVFSIALILPLVLGLATPAYRRSASGTISVPITTHFNTNSGLNIAEADRARVRSLIENAQKPIDKLKTREDVPVTNKAVTYTISVGVGSPPTNYNLIVDTGSSNTWVGANAPYEHTSTSLDTGKQVSVTYGSGSFSGTEFYDQLTFSSDLVFNQSIGVASTSSGFNDVNGILGIGPVNLTQGTVQDVDSVPTVVDSLFEQGLIENNLVSVFFQPTIGDNTNPAGTGELNFGGIDETIGFDIFYTPITSTSPASQYWGINQTVSFPDQPILPQSAGIVDTGTTLTLLASDAFAAYQKATGATMDDATGLLKLSREQFLTLEPLLFQIGDTIFELTADAQAWPQHLNSAIGGDPDGIYLIVSSSGSPSGEGLDFINGQTFLQRFYSVYDTGNQRVGLSQTVHTYDIVNVPL